MAVDRWDAREDRYKMRCEERWQRIDEMQGKWLKIGEMQRKMAKDRWD